VTAPHVWLVAPQPNPAAQVKSTSQVEPIAPGGSHVAPTQAAGAAQRPFVVQGCPAAGRTVHVAELLQYSPVPHCTACPSHVAPASPNITCTHVGVAIE
jgi:hypothetical protein